MKTKQLLYPLFFIFLLSVVSATTTCSQINTGFGEGGFGEGGMATGSESCVTTTPASSSGSSGSGVGGLISSEVMSKLTKKDIKAKDVWTPNSIKNGDIHKITDMNIPLRKVTFNIEGQSSYPTWQVVVEKQNADPKIFSVFTVDAKIDNLKSVDIEIEIPEYWLKDNPNWVITKDGVELPVKLVGLDGVKRTYKATITSFSEFIIRSVEEVPVVAPVEQNQAPVAPVIIEAPVQEQTVTPAPIVEEEKTTMEKIVVKNNNAKYFFIVLVVALLGVLIGIVYRVKKDGAKNDKL